MFAYFVPLTGDGWKNPAVITPETGREWVRWAKGKGIDGLKLFGGDPEIMAAVLSEANRLKLGSVAHLAQNYVAVQCPRCRGYGPSQRDALLRSLRSSPEG